MSKLDSKDVPLTQAENPILDVQKESLSAGQVTLSSEGYKQSHKKHKKHDHEHGGSHGGTEMGWLVSYADMMTLLFGLFVVLFSLSQGKPGNADRVMRDVSKQFFSSNTDTPQERVPASIDSVNLGATTVVESKVPTEPTVSMTEHQEVKKIKEQVESELKKSESENVSLKAEIEKLLSELEIEKSKPVITKDETKKDDSFKKIVELQQKIEKMHMSLAESEKNKIALEEKIQNLEQKIETQAKNYVNFMTVILTWPGEKQDYDLEIIDADGKTFNFKKRKYASVPGSFEVDSRYGPGIEMWKAENFKAGNYEAKIKLYSRNGNEQQAKFNLNVISNFGTYKKNDMVFDGAPNEKVIRFKVSENGAVTFTE